MRDGVAPRFEAPPPRPVGEIDLTDAREAPMPDFIPPMRATLADSAFDDPDWLFEIKWDGYRVEAVIRDGRAKLWTRNQQDAARYFPELAGPAEWLEARDAIVDGEVVALDEAGRPSFSLLQDRTGIRTGRAPGTARHGPPAPALYQVFDLLHIDGRSLLAVPLEERKRLLRSRLRPSSRVRYAGHVEADGRAFTEAARAQELEGIVAKLRRSPYEPGRRSKSWLKIKLRREQEVVVVGWLEGQGTHRDLGSLIVAVRSGDRWAHAGQVGSGIDTRTRRELRAKLDELARDASVLDPVPRLRGAHWVEPKLVIRVEFADWTADNLLRQAAFKGLEIGKAPTSVRREREVDTATATAAAEREVQTEPMQTDDDEAALAAIEREGVWRAAGREVRVTNLEKVLFPGRDGGAAGHEARPVQVPPRHRSDAGAVPARPRADRAALPERRRGEGLLAEGPAEARARLGQSMDVPPPRGGAEGLPGRRRARDAAVAGPGGGHRAPPVDVAGRDAGPAVVRPHRHRPRARTPPGTRSWRWRGCIARR